MTKYQVLIYTLLIKGAAHNLKSSVSLISCSKKNNKKKKASFILESLEVFSFKFKMAPIISIKHCRLLSTSSDPISSF